MHGTKRQLIGSKFVDVSNVGAWIVLILFVNATVALVSPWGLFFSEKWSSRALLFAFWISIVVMLLARKLELDQRVRGFKELAFTESERGSLRRTDVARLFIPTQTGVLAWIPFMRMWHDVEYRHNLDVLQMLRALTPDSPDAETLDRFTVPFERAAEQGKSTLILPRRENRALHEWLNDFAQPRS